MPDSEFHDAEALQTEIAVRRADMALCIAELSDIAKDTLDVKAQLRRWSRRALDRVRERVRDNPRPYLAAAGVLVALAVARAALKRRRAHLRTIRLRVVT